MMQTALPFDGRRAITPIARTSEPLIWVRSIAVLRELLPGKEHVVRRIALHRGLNVLWARPARQDGEGTTSGHDAGKTTFCRFIRHVLGEPTFGTKEFREALRLRLPRGWIVADVVVDGIDWVVGRPIGIGLHPFAARDTNAEALLDGGTRGSFADYEAALRAAITRDLSVSMLPQSQTSFDWLHLLPWIARDQEARFANFLGWRDSTSESGAPDTTADDRHAIARATLGLLSSEEAAAQSRAARLNATIEELRTELPMLRAAREAEARRLATHLDGSAVALGDLVEGVARAKLDELQRGSQPRASDEYDRLTDELVTEANAVAAALARLESLRKRHESQRDVVAGLEGGRVDALFARHGMEGDRCYAPMSLAVAHGCPLVKDRPVQLAEFRTKRDASADLADMKAELKDLERQVAHVEQQLHDAEERHRAVTDRFRAHRRSVREADAAQIRCSERADRLREQLDVFSRAKGRCEEAESRLADAEKELLRAREEQRELRQLNAPRLGQISQTYDFVIKSLLGEGAAGKISEQGRELRLAVTQRGTVRGAALTTMKLLAFDFTALIARIEGLGAFPSILIHDGPREADMDEALYRRLFFFALRVERAFDGEPGFQYIVTTTAPPPEDVEERRRLLEPILDASTPAGRLLCMDL